MTVKVKVCGVTRASDALLASDLGASAVGFVFWERSPRYVEPERAREIAAVLPADVAAVGVFVDPSRAYLESVAIRVGLTAIQLHGDETTEFCVGLPYRVIKAMHLQDSKDADRVTGLPQTLTVLLDVGDPVRRGGTGQTIDWTLASTVARRRRVFLAGGLTPANVTDAVETVRPYAVDVSSGLEAAPGTKDPELLRAFFEAISALGPTSEESRRWATENQV